MWNGFKSILETLTTNIFELVCGLKMIESSPKFDQKNENVLPDDWGGLCWIVLHQQDC